MIRVLGAAAPLVAFLGLAIGCAPAVMVPLAGAVPLTRIPPAGLELVTRSTGIHDPLALPGSRVVFGGLEEPLGHAIASAAAPWVAAHTQEQPDGWRLLVELVHADVQRPDQRIVVTLGVRATLRQRRGNVYVAQSQAHCHAAAHLQPRDAAPVFYACMMDIGRELAGWLDSVIQSRGAP